MLKFNNGKLIIYRVNCKEYNLKYTLYKFS